MRVNEAIIPSQRFFSNHGLRWYYEVQLASGVNIFDISAGVRTFSDTGSLFDSDVPCWLLQEIPSSGSIDDWDDDGPWTTADAADMDDTEEDVTPFDTNDIPTRFFWYDFDIPADVIVTSGELVVTHDDGVGAYLDGENVYLANLVEGWEYSDWATASPSGEHTAVIAGDLLGQGTHRMGFAHKSASGDPPYSFVFDATLYMEFTKVEWSDPQRVTIRMSDNQVDEFQNFNDVDEWGLVMGVSRLPQEKNVHYKERLQEYVESGFGSTTKGVLSGTSVRLGLNSNQNGIRVNLRANTLLRESPPLVDDLQVFIRDGEIALISQRFRYLESPELQDGYNRLPLNGEPYQVEHVYGLSQGDLEQRNWVVRDDGMIYILCEPDELGYEVDYLRRITMDTHGASTLDVTTWLNTIEVSGVDSSGAPASFPAFDAYVDPSLVFLSYSGDFLAVDGSLVIPSEDLTTFADEEDLYFHQPGQTAYYHVDSITASGVTISSDWAANMPSGSGEFVFVKAPSADYVPAVPISVGEEYFGIPIFEIQFRGLMQSDWDDYYNGSGAVAEDVSKIRDALRESWNEIVADQDVWNLIGAGIGGGDILPSIMDGNKTPLTSGDYRSGSDGIELSDITPDTSGAGREHIDYTATKLWEDPSVSGAYSIGYCLERPFDSRTCIDPIDTSGGMTILDSQKDFRFIITESGAGAFFDRSVWNRDCDHHIVGMESTAEIEELLGLALSHDDTAKEPLRDLLIPKALHYDEMVFGGFDTDNMIVLANTIKDEDVIRDGPTLVLRLTQ